MGVQTKIVCAFCGQTIQDGASPIRLEMCDTCRNKTLGASRVESWLEIRERQRLKYGDEYDI